MRIAQSERTKKLVLKSKKFIFKIYSKSIDLDKAAAIENDENMIINSDHTIITTPIESPESDDIDNARKTRNHLTKFESDETPTSDEMNAVDNIGKKKRHKARSESTRSTKYAIFFVCFFIC